MITWLGTSADSLDPCIAGAGVTCFASLQPEGSVQIVQKAGMRKEQAILSYAAVLPGSRRPSKGLQPL